MLIDSHCHLNLLTDLSSRELVARSSKNIKTINTSCFLDTVVKPRYDTVLLDSVIQRALENNVQYMQTICTKLEDFSIVLEIAEKYENIFASVGVHPCEVNESSRLITDSEIIELTKHPKIIGIGETGLDYYHQPYDKKLQKDSFVAHIHAAAATNLPIIVHTREADEDTIDILTSEMRNSKFPGLIHCFTSSKKLAEKMLDIGLYISMSGIITFKNATDLQEIVKYIPLDRLLIETDSPYLAPTPMRGKQNEPAFVRYVAEKVAELKNITSKEVANVTTRNFKTLFSKFEKHTRLI
ncbi:TatD family hydrolase [Rickettsia hoogstraalii]|uniref:TatD family hydrolase n=1 Tax=Rickettsia hoogstraalii TaxID=467174 RepID=UPI0022579652|nr:TatD family hydrolase [Rickettsia hoogstraalii]MCX4084297.1 TatD family hydrolase [Rickettsia hoogstraalii]